MNQPQIQFVNNRQRILAEAMEITSKDRNQAYGPPEQNFRNIANLWMSYFQAQGHDFKIWPADVAALMILMKVARLSTNQGHKDSWVDVAGYAACGFDAYSSSSINEATNTKE